MGPALVCSEEIADPRTLTIHTSVGGEVRQAASAAEMLFAVDELIAFASRLMTLEPGDVVLTGTPPGVGAGFDPPRWLADGDVVEVEIPGVGRLASYVRQAA